MPGLLNNARNSGPIVWWAERRPREPITSCVEMMTGRFHHDIPAHTRKYRLTDLPFLKVIGENAIKVDVLIKLSISRGITGIRRFSSCGIWFPGAEV